MSPNLLADQALDLITRHPLAAGIVAIGSAVLSWLLTRAREAA